MARRPKRSDSFAISGVPMRFVSTYALKIHDPAREFSPNSASMAGSAGPTIAMSSAPMSTPTNSTATVRLRCLSSTGFPNRAVSQESRTNGSPIANPQPASVTEVSPRTVVEREHEVEHDGAGGRQRDDCRGHDRERRNDDGPVEHELYVAGPPPKALLREQSHRVEAAEARLVTEQDQHAHAGEQVADSDRVRAVEVRLRHRERVEQREGRDEHDRDQRANRERQPLAAQGEREEWQVDEHVDDRERPARAVRDEQAQPGRTARHSVRTVQQVDAERRHECAAEQAEDVLDPPVGEGIAGCLLYTS